ncbi:MAG: isoprenyl transferase [Phycisphaera sp.]|nr:isoprenyl transferase [Phycisphaera sp.]
MSQATHTNPIAAQRAKDTAASFAMLGLPREVLPRHIAIIMDGNGRWAEARGKKRQMGHLEGAKAVRAIVTECARLELDVLTLYSFSIENWRRPTDEIEFLMDLYVEYLQEERRTMMDNNVRFAQVGRRLGLPQRVLDELDNTLEATRHNTGLTLALALNYGSRTEITDAVRAIAHKVKTGQLDPDSIDESTISDHLYTAPLPVRDPDLLIRTAGEMRVSNYLLWQISYAELHVADVCWPDFTPEHLRAAIRDFAKRHRKFGGVPEKS